MSWHLLFNKYFHLSNTASEQRVLWHKEIYAYKLYIDPHKDVTALGFPGVSNGKESSCSAGGLGSIPGLGRSPGEGNGYPPQYSGLENFMDCVNTHSPILLQLPQYFIQGRGSVQVC